MKKLIITLTLILAIGLAMTPAIASDGYSGPCPGYGTGTPVSFLPLYNLALGQVNTLTQEVHAAMEGSESNPEVEEKLSDINDLVKSATLGSNYIYQKDLLLLAKGQLEATLAMI